MKYGHRFSGAMLAPAFAAAGLPRMRITAATGSARDVQLDRTRVPVWQQGRRGSCVTHAGLACAAYVGAVPVNPSRHLVDYHCRLDHGEQCIDDGTWPHVLVSVLATLGSSTEDREPYTDDFAIRPCDFAEQGAYDHRISIGHALDGDGDTLDLVEECLRNGAPVFGGWNVNTAFENLTAGDIWQGPGAVTLGGHSLAVWGVEYALGMPESADPRIWTIRNSWGEGFADRGYARFASSALRSGGDFCLFGGAT